MSPRVRAILDQIEASAKSLDITDQMELWWILTALRGPDSCNQDLKEMTTAQVRALTLPYLSHVSLADVAGFYGIPHLPALLTALEVRNNHSDTPGHFLTHYDRARRAITKI